MKNIFKNMETILLVLTIAIITVVLITWITKLILEYGIMVFIGMAIIFSMVICYLFTIPKEITIDCQEEEA